MSAAIFLMLLMAVPLIEFFFHALVCRAAIKTKVSFSTPAMIMIAFSFSALVVGSAGWQLYLSRISGTQELFMADLYGTLLFTLLSICYFVLFAMTEAARRIRMLNMIHDRKSVDRPEMERMYGAARMLEIRMDRMTALGQLRRSGDRYYAKGGSVYWIARILSAWAKLLGAENRS